MVEEALNGKGETRRLIEKKKRENIYIICIFERLLLGMINNPGTRI